MNTELAEPVISRRNIQIFVEAAFQETGEKNLLPMLEKVGLLPSALEKDSLSCLDGKQAAELYALLQEALRLFYGRGARGILLRIGQRMWDRMMAQANFREKAGLEIARRLPVPARRRRVLNLVAEQLREGGGVTLVHTLDLDLLLADHCGAATVGQSSAEPICFVTLGLIQGALFWATGQEADVEEIACKATGAPACEFKVKLGGK